MYASARKQREGAIGMAQRVLEPTVEEMSEIYGDWAAIMEQMEGDD